MICALLLASLAFLLGPPAGEQEVDAGLRAVAREPSPSQTRDDLPAPPSTTSAPTPPVVDGMRLSVPALGLATTVDEVSPVGGTIDPPTFDRAYRIAPYGTPASDNTTYIAGHSWNAGDAVFNPLLDVESQEATLAAGDVVEVVEDGVTFRYEVVSTARYPKGTLADVDEVWQKVPGRLVLITCFQLDTGARSRDNLVVTAQLLPDQPAPGQPSAPGPATPADTQAR